MTQENNQPATDLKSWWEQAQFEAKPFYDLNEQGELLLKEYPGYKQRPVGTLTPDSADVVFKLLQEKFPEVQAKVKELLDEWNAEQDKLKLVGKVERVKEYLHHANAVGNFHELFTIVNNIEKELAALIEENYNKKLALVQKAEGLAESSEWKEASESLKTISEEWKAIGHIDKRRGDELWDRMERARDKFFERKRGHQEDINKEMLQNLDLKMELVEQAENLAASGDWKNATQAFTDLMEKWKGIGRTMHDKNEELWNRFITAKNAFFEKKKEHFDVIQKEQEDNYATKVALVEQAEAMQESTEWNETTQAYTNLMEEWKKVGRVPREKSDEIWARFNAARDKFFNRKRENLESFKMSLDDNYAQKMALLKRAEALQDATQWREATEELNELMTEWKKIGPVPRKFSDEIWERFIKARKTFFDRKDANRERRKQHMERRSADRVHQTEDFIGKLQAELKEEEEKLADFKDGLENITPGLKEVELREHLTKLIEQTEKKIAHKKEKLEEAQKQLGSMGGDKQ